MKTTSPNEVISSLNGIYEYVTERPDVLRSDLLNGTNRPRNAVNDPERISPTRAYNQKNVYRPL